MNDTTRPALTLGALTEEFSRRMREALTPTELAIVNERNIQLLQTHPDCCASHDFIDANEVMIAALQHFVGDIDSEDQLKSLEEYLDLTNAAWTTAKRRGFAA